MSASVASVKDVKNKKDEVVQDDDEFEDFPVQDWSAAAGAGACEALWETTWDADATDGDFTQQLRAEMDRVEKGGK